MMVRLTITSWKRHRQVLLLCSEPDCSIILPRLFLHILILDIINLFLIQLKPVLSIGGWQIDLGVRFYLFGNRDYETGY